MATTVKINGQKLDLNANPDLLLQLLIDVTNLEEYMNSIVKNMNSIDKRLSNIEKKVNPPKPTSQYLITKKT